MQQQFSSNDQQFNEGKASEPEGVAGAVFQLGNWSWRDNHAHGTISLLIKKLLVILGNPMF